jgi:hypothetical protein
VSEVVRRDVEDTAPVVALVRWRVEHVRWPTLDDVARPEDSVLVGRSDLDGSLIMAADPTMAWTLYAEAEAELRHAEVSARLGALASQYRTEFRAALAVFHENLRRAGYYVPEGVAMPRRADLIRVRPERTDRRATRVVCSLDHDTDGAGRRPLPRRVRRPRPEGGAQAITVMDAAAAATGSRTASGRGACRA